MKPDAQRLYEPSRGGVNAQGAVQNGLRGPVLTPGVQPITISRVAGMR